MKLLIAATAVVSIFVASCRPAAAWDIDGAWDWGWDEPAYDSWEPAWQDEPAYEPAPAYEPVPAYEPEPFYIPDPVRVYEPAYEPQPAWEPEPIAAVRDRDEAMREAGLHEVTEVHGRDIVISDGPRTTYTTTTEREDPGTAARLVMHVGTGELTGLDDSIVNGRLARNDGLQAAGDLYQNYYWDGDAWVSNGLYFFNDDSELAQQPVPGTDRPGGPSGLSPAGPGGAASDPASRPGSTPASASPSDSAPASAGGEIVWWGSLTDRPTAEREGPGGSSSGPVRPGTPAVHHEVSVGISLESQGDVLGRVEVLRGRAIHLWPRAFVDGVPGSVISWRLASGELTALGPVAGGGEQPLAAMWEHVAAAGLTFPVLIEADVAVPGLGVRTLQASLAVAVRSPALVE